MLTGGLGGELDALVGAGRGHEVDDRSEHLAHEEPLLGGIGLEDERRTHPSIGESLVGDGLGLPQHLAAVGLRLLDPLDGPLVLDRTKDLHGAFGVAKQPVHRPHDRLGDLVEAHVRPGRVDPAGGNKDVLAGGAHLP